MKFLPPFLFQKIEVFVALIHYFEFKLCSGAQNNFSIPSKLAKKCNFRFPRPGTSDVIRCVSL